LKTIVSTVAVIAILSGCTLLAPQGKPAAGAIRYGADGGELMAFDSMLKTGSSRDDLLKAVSGAVQVQLSGGIAANATVVSHQSAARYPLEPALPKVTAIDPAKLDPTARRSAFMIGGKAIVCTRPSMVVHGRNVDSTGTGQRAHIFACVMPFDWGYRTVVYAHLGHSAMPGQNKNSRFDDASFTATTFGIVRSAIEAHSSRVTAVAPSEIRQH
jgi:hypothetical protein